MSHDILLLGSQSSSRKELLTEAGIAFTTIPHHSSELETPFTGDLAGYAIGIAQHKMESLILPTPQEIGRTTILVLTADSVVQHSNSKELLGKPTDMADAHRMLASARSSSMLIMTGCCLREYFWQGDSWTINREEVWATSAVAEFIVAQDEVAHYLARCPQALHSAGAGILEGYGANYLKSITGSFSGGRGLPIFELRQALKAFGFNFYGCQLAR
jgi:septum formation protein